LSTVEVVINKVEMVHREPESGSFSTKMALDTIHHKVIPVSRFSGIIICAGSQQYLIL
jgi:hypothetical protein